MDTLRPKPHSQTLPAVLAVLALAEMLEACSQGSTQIPASAGSAPVPGPALAPRPASLNNPAPDNGAGIWLGKLSRRGEIVNTASCLIIEVGEIACVLYQDEPTIVLATDPVVGAYGIPQTATGGAHGNIDLADTSQLTGSGTLYAAPGSFLSDGMSTVAPFTITSGYLTDIAGTTDNPIQKRIDLTISSLGEVSALQAEFDHYYFRERHGDFSSDWIEGVYATFAIFDDPASLSIDADGSLFSQSSSGCVLSGDIGIIDWPYNGYAATVILETCAGLTGAYSGLAFLDDFSYVNGTDDLLIAVFNGTNFIAGKARKYQRVLP